MIHIICAGCGEIESEDFIIYEDDDTYCVDCFDKLNQDKEGVADEKSNTH
jgi:hypothetical protein